MDLVEIEDFPVLPHGVPEVAQELDNLLKRGVNLATQEGVSEIRYLDNLHRFLLHALWPGKFGPLLGFTGAEQGLEPLLDIIHQILGGIGIVQEILPDDELDGLLNGKQERSGKVPAVVRIDGRSGRGAVIRSGGTGSGSGGVNLIQ